MSSDRWPAPDRETGAPALVVDRLTKRFGDRVAFRDVSFEVGYGEVFGFGGLPAVDSWRRDGGGYVIAVSASSSPPSSSSPGRQWRPPSSAVQR